MGGGASAVWSTPAGVRDFTPELAGAFYEMQDAVTRILREAGYRPIVTPTFELAHVFERGIGAADAARVLRFVDPQNGELLALRSDITPQIARLVAGPLRLEATPLRLSYFGHVFRLRQHAEFQRREIHQAGAELIGAAGVEADVEILRLCDRALVPAGDRRRVLSVGHVGVMAAALAGIEMPPDEATELHERLRRRDSAGARALLRGLGATARADLVASLLTLAGDATAVLREARALGAKTLVGTLDELARLVAQVAEQPLTAELLLDLGETLGSGYYTGLVFHAYVDGLGQPVASGGRYDGLLAKYGRDLPAAGFAIDGEVLTEARTLRSRT